jgi:hypothetical protein
MPLRVAAGIPIAPAEAAPRVGVEAAVAAPPMLNVPYFRQEQSEWCWAACAQMVAGYLDNPNVQQCELANFLHKQTDCCDVPDSEACNQPCPYQGIGQVYSHLRINCISDPFPENAQVILRELLAGRPVEVGYLWLGGGGHVALIRGITDDGNYYAVHDPAFGSGPVTPLYLYTAYGSGRWAYSFGGFWRL